MFRGKPAARTIWSSNKRELSPLGMVQDVSLLLLCAFPPLKCLRAVMKHAPSFSANPRGLKSERNYVCDYVRMECVSATVVSLWVTDVLCVCVCVCVCASLVSYFHFSFQYSSVTCGTESKRRCYGACGSRSRGVRILSTDWTTSDFGIYTHTHTQCSLLLHVTVQCVCVCVSSLNNNPEKTMQRPPETLGCGKKRQHSHEHSGLNWLQTLWRNE